LTTFAPLIAFAITIMTFCSLESAGDAFHFRCRSLCFVDFSIVMDNQALKQFLAGVFRTDEGGRSIFSPLRKALPDFVSDVVIQLRPDMTFTTVDSAIEEF
jgi:hypothetical protein